MTLPARSPHFSVVSDIMSLGVAVVAGAGPGIGKVMGKLQCH